MPWQLSGNGRSGWSTKLIRGLKAEAAAGFQSRRERCREPTPVTPQYAAFTTYKAARVRHANGRRGSCMATRCARAAAGDADYGFFGHSVIALLSVPYAIVPPRLEGSGIYRGPKRCNRISFGGRPIRSAARHVGRSDRSSGSDDRYLRHRSIKDSKSSHY